MDFPEPLYETYYLPQPKVCLVCGKDKATSVLRTVSQDVCPMCSNCASEWNIAGYRILRKIDPNKVVQNLFIYKMSHWNPGVLTIIKDIKAFKDWNDRQKKFKHLME